MIVSKWSYVKVTVLLIHLACGGLGSVLKYQDEAQGLYSPTDKIEIFTKENYKSYLYNQSFAWLIEYYNSYCGFCKNFAPEWKAFALSVHGWRDFVKIGAIDCAVDENNGVCRNFDILGYPTLKFFHENYPDAADQVGLNLKSGPNAERLVDILSMQMQREQYDGRGKAWPALTTQNFTQMTDVWLKLQPETDAVFLIFESQESSTGVQVILDLHIMKNIKIWKVSSTHPFAKALSVNFFPCVYSIDKDRLTSTLVSIATTRNDIQFDIMRNLIQNNIKIPDDIKKNTVERQSIMKKPTLKETDNFKPDAYIGNTIYQSDLEAGLRYSLNHEITSVKKINGEALVSLRNYIDILIKYFPFKANGRLFMTKLKESIAKNTEEWSGEDIQHLIESLEVKYDPVYSTDLKWIGCKGSVANYRGYTCSLWLIFHTLTVNAATMNLNSTEVLHTMYGYVKYFFGCTDCSMHFQEMAERNQIYSVTENDGAVLWLWVAHNQVNHRLSGDETEDPMYPKQQFPPEIYCPECRDSGETWNIRQVNMYLKRLYGSDNINSMGSSIPNRSAGLSNFDKSILWVLYFYCLVAIVCIGRLFCTNKMYRKKSYVYGTYGKV